MSPQRIRVCVCVCVGRATFVRNSRPVPTSSALILYDIRSRRNQVGPRVRSGNSAASSPLASLYNRSGVGAAHGESPFCSIHAHPHTRTPSRRSHTLSVLADRARRAPARSVRDYLFRANLYLYAIPSTPPPPSGRAENVSGDNSDRRHLLRRLRRHPVVVSTTTDDSSSDHHSSPPPRPRLQPPQQHDHVRRRHQSRRPPPLVCRRCLMLRPVCPVVRLPYDRPPDRVARVLDAVRREFRASRQRQSATAAAAPAPTLATTTAAVDCSNQPPPPPWLSATAMTATDQTTGTTPMQTTAAAAVYVDQIVDQVTVGVRDCTLTPKARPEILVTAGGVTPVRNAYLDSSNNNNNNKQHLSPFGADGGPYLLVPPVNITAEISRPPLTPQYTTAS